MLFGLHGVGSLKQKKPMNKYDIHYYKEENLSPDELNAMRRNATGVWIAGGRIEAKSKKAACSLYRKSGDIGSDARKLRAVL